MFLLSSYVSLRVRYSCKHLDLLHLWKGRLGISSITDTKFVRQSRRRIY